MSIQSTVVPQDRSEGVRCVIVCPGDVLILAGVDHTSESAQAGLEKLRQDLGLRFVLAVRDLTDVSVRDLDAELAEARRQLDSYGKLFELNSKTLNDTIDRMHAAERRVAELELAARTSAAASPPGVET